MDSGATVRDVSCLFCVERRCFTQTDPGPTTLISPCCLLAFVIISCTKSDISAKSCSLQSSHKRFSSPAGLWTAAEVGNASIKGSYKQM